MNPHQNHTDLRHVFQQLCAAENFAEMMRVWRENAPLLRDCRLIVSHSGDRGLHCEKFIEHPKVTKLFAKDKFFYFDQSVVANHFSGVEEMVSVEMITVLDTNIVAKIKSFINKNCGDEKTRLYIESFVGKPFYYGFYALENFEDYRAGKNHSQIRDKIKAALSFSNLDSVIYQASGGDEIKIKLSEAELERETDEKIKEMFTQESLSYLIAFKNAIYALLLKTTEIQFRAIREGIIKPADKITEIYRFMHFELSRLFGREAHLIAIYFAGDARLKDSANKNLSFFDPIQISNNRILHSLNGMAFDLTLLRLMERLPDASQHAQMLLPFLVSDDGRLSYVCDELLPKMSAILFYGQERCENYLSKWENEQQFEQNLLSQNFYPQISWFYDTAAFDARVKEQHANSKIRNLDFAENIRNLERLIEERYI